MKILSHDHLIKEIRGQYLEHSEYIDVTGWDVSNITYLGNAFNNYMSLEEIIGLETWDVSNVTGMPEMFKGCENLKELDLSNWNTSNVVNMREMFCGCSKLEQIKGIENWDVSNVKDMNGIFYFASNINIPLRYNFNGSIIFQKTTITTPSTLLTKKEYKRCISLLYSEDKRWNVGKIEKIYLKITKPLSIKKQYLFHKNNLKRMFNLNINEYLNKSPQPEPLLKDIDGIIKIKPHNSSVCLEEINCNIKQINDLLLLTQYSKLYTGMQLPPLTIGILTDFQNNIEPKLNLVAYYDNINTQSKLGTIEGIVSNCHISSKEIDVAPSNKCVQTICYIGLNKIILNVAKRDRKLRKQLKTMFSLIKRVNPLTYDNLMEQLKTIDLCEEENYE